METLGPFKGSIMIILGFIGVNIMVILELYRNNGKKMEAAISGLGFRF